MIEYKLFDNEKNKTKYNYIKFTLTLSLLLSLVVCFISYIIFGIIYLIKDYDVNNNCSSSYLWYYVLISLIITPFSKYNINYFYENKSYLFMIVFIASIDLILASWGSVELFNNSCNNLNKLNLWKFGIISFVLQILSILILLIIIPCVKYNVNKKINNISNKK